MNLAIAEKTNSNFVLEDPEGEGLCDNSLGMSINGQEVQPWNICPGTWVKVTWNRNFPMCYNTDPNPGLDPNFNTTNQNVWSVLGVSEVFRGANGTFPVTNPSPNDPAYITVADPSNWYSFVTLEPNGDGTEIYVKFTLAYSVGIVVEANTCGGNGGTAAALDPVQ